MQEVTGNIEKHKREIRLSHLSETTLIVESSICPQIVRKIIEYRNKAVLFHFILDWSLEVEDKASHGSMNVNPCVSKVSQLQPTSPDLCSPLFHFYIENLSSAERTVRKNTRFEYARS